MTIWFGRPGQQVELPHPRGGVQVTRERPASPFRTGSGGVRVGQAVGGKRQVMLSWQRLWYETTAVIEAFAHGHEGPGPFVLHDPSRVNWLTVNQSAATSHLNDTTGFGADNGAGGASGYDFDDNLSSSATAYHRGPRSLRWLVDNAAPGPSGGVLDTLQLHPASDTWPGIPIVPGEELCFSCWVYGDPVDPVDTLTARLAWLDAAGEELSTTDGTPVAPSSDWTQISVSDEPPEDAVYVLCRVVAAGEAMAEATAVLHLDEFQLELGSAPTTWRPGTGIYPMAVISMDERWPWQAEGYREGVRLVLQEVGSGV